ncbi:MAG: TonB-dependent receptor plug domain-containing protein [Thermomonas sp.]|uniref:TonB-dependent receptor plug domain-containing protein n=1 Tax=Thermomonas sp. TaxID=1971895 RepID=UPI0039E5AC73
MVQLKRNLLSVALATATMMLTAQVHAQSAQPADQTEEDAAAAKKKAEDAKTLDKVTVTGIRGAIERAMDLKQESTSIVEAVSAEDIGKLPDQSIADSLARLPGLTAQRERGRAAQINIRGFDGNFAATTLNGREQATTSDSRSVEFDQYPSELLSSVVVYKTPDAKLVGQGLSGTVDLRTVRPLDYDERQVSFGARYDQNKIRGQEETGYRYNLSYIDQFADGKVGLAIGFAHMDSPQPGYQNEPWGYTAFSKGDPTLQIIGGSKFYKFNVDNKRDGLMATLQLRPNDFWEGTVDWMYSKYERAEIKTGTEFWTEWGGGRMWSRAGRPTAAQ